MLCHYFTKHHLHLSMAGLQLAHHQVEWVALVVRKMSGHFFIGLCAPGMGENRVVNRILNSHF